MNILQFSTDISRGGATQVMLSLHHEFKRQGHESVVFGRVGTPDPQNGILNWDTVVPMTGLPGLFNRYGRAARLVERFLGMPAFLYPQTVRLKESACFKTCDALIIHNMAGSFFNYRALPELSAIKPVIWVFHDMWPVTGHCSYAYECEKYRNGCGSCPQLVGRVKKFTEPSPPVFDITGRIWKEKHACWKKSRFTAVTPSRWLQEIVRQTPLKQNADVVFIRNGIETDFYLPGDKSKAKARFKIPAEKKVITILAHNLNHPRSGMDKLAEALRKIEDRRLTRNLIILAVGSNSGIKPEPFGRIPVTFTEFLENPVDIRSSFQAADVMAFPAEASNCPLNILQSLACGTPVVAFDHSGASELIRDGETGFLAPCGDTERFAECLFHFLKTSESCASMSRNARDWTVKQGAIVKSATKYLTLLQSQIN